MDMPTRVGYFDRRDLMILVGYPSSGKTEFAFFLAKENAKVGVSTVIMSIEMKKKDILLRSARKKIGVSKARWQKKQISEHEKEQIKEEYEKMCNMDGVNVIGYETNPTIDDLVDQIKEYKQKGHLLFIIDNLGQIRAGENMSEIETQVLVTQKLRMLVNSEDICIILLHHLNKPSRSNAYEPGGTGAIRGSQKIVDNATLIFELWRDLDPDTQATNEAKLIMCKDTQDGAKGEIDLLFDKGNYVIRPKSVLDAMG